ncbi:hypothetical protein DRO19_00800 [Candidatus Bathyarchaeota archaeon]|nr:MAG: hypothetical protein DRO19_00800 [Candidatus Bathyarchaeota archaeon]
MARFFIQRSLFSTDIQTRPVQLRDYQHQALIEFLKRKKGVIEAATGTGKTFIAIEALRRLDLPTVILAPTIPIMKTVWEKRLREYGFPSVGLYYGDEKRDGAKILVATYQSAIKHQHIMKRPMIIMDECHHVSSPVWSKLLDYVPQAEYVLGLTATLGRRWSERYKTITKFLPVIFTYEIWRARMDGWVADTRIFSVPVKLTPLEMGEYERLCDKIRTAIFKLGTHDPTEWQKLAKEGNETAKKALWALTRRRILLSKAENKLTATLSIIYRNMKYGKILLFTESIDAVEILKRFLAKHGISALTYHSKMPKQKRALNLKRWGSGKVKVLLSVRALDEGIDVPDASVGVFHASGRTKRQIVQRLGRILRPKPDGSPAKIYVVWAERTIERQVLEEVVRAVRRAKHVR